MIESGAGSRGGTDVIAAGTGAPVSAAPVQLMLGDFAPPLNPDLSQFFTPPDLCERMVEWAGVRPGMVVLEPSAGGGNIVRALTARGALVMAVEIDPAWAKVLATDESLRGSGSLVVMNEDFMASRWSPESFDLAVQNTPYENGQDGSWIVRALQFAPRVVALCPARVLHGQKRFETLWSKHSLRRLVNLAERPKFVGDGGMFDLVIVEVVRQPGLPCISVEFWS